MKIFKISRRKALTVLVILFLAFGIPLAVLFTSPHQRQNIQHAAAPSTPTPTISSTPPPFSKTLPETTENIHVALSFNDHVANYSMEEGVVDYVWASSTPNQPPGVYNGYYLKFDRDNEGTNYNLAWFQANHPDWIVYQCDKKTPATEFGSPLTPLDITNPAVLQWYLTTYIYPALDKGYLGIDFDNVNLSNSVGDGYDGPRCGVWQIVNGQHVWKYLYGETNSIHGQAYVDSVVNWAKFMSNAIHTYKHPGTIMMNVSIYTGESIAYNEMLYPYMDMYLDERGWSNWGQGYLGGKEWQTEIQKSLDLDKQGKGIYFVNQEPNNFSNLTRDQIQWALSNYLLVKGKHTYILITGNQQYGYLEILPEYSAKIGHPTNAMYESQGIYMRDYSNGKTIVNPSSTQSFKITLPVNIYHDLYGNTINSINLGVHSGIVLLTRGFGGTSPFPGKGEGTIVNMRGGTRDGRKWLGFVWSAYDATSYFRVFNRYGRNTT